LSFNANALGVAGAAAVVARRLQGMEALRALRLDSNATGDAGAMAVARELRHAPRLEDLGLADNAITATGGEVVARELAHIKLLDLAGNILGDAGAGAVVRAPRGAALEALDLGENGIGDAGVEAVARELRHTSLKRLDFSDNNIGAKGAASLARWLRYASSLEELRLGKNPIGECCATFGEGASLAPNLLRLNVCRCDIGDADAISLARGLRRAPQQRELYIRENDITPLGAEGTMRELR